jgi:zinc and cadmium transporter
MSIIEGGTTMLSIIVAVLMVSLISLVGVIFLVVGENILSRILTELVSFATGALLGAAFLHMIPEAFEALGPDSLRLVVLGILSFFILERFLYWRHCHEAECKTHTFVYLNLFGDGVHNFVDGLVIAASFIAGSSFGIITTLAIVAHEIPQELGDFGVLVYGGLSKTKALLFNLLSALTAVVGGVVGYFISTHAMGFSSMLIPFVAGGFIYIAGSDLIPEIHKERSFSKTVLQLASLLLGLAVIVVSTTLVSHS